MSLAHKPTFKMLKKNIVASTTIGCWDDTTNSELAELEKTLNPDAAKGTKQAAAPEARRAPVTIKGRMWLYIPESTAFNKKDSGSLYQPTASSVFFQPKKCFERSFKDQYQKKHPQKKHALLT